MKAYAHVDADCFYVSCERLRDPRLEGKPVAVLGNQGACVIAQSYEMKAAGVEVAMPIWMAKQICPTSIFVKRDFQWYGVLSRAMQSLLHEFSDKVEYYSIDESFMDLGQVLGARQSLAERIQKRMREATSLPVSVGIAGTRTLCKLASKCKKPYGALSIDESNRELILNETPLEKVNGIGRRLIKKAHQMGLRSALDFAKADQRKIKHSFHKPGEAIWYELNGYPIHSIVSEKQAQKVVSRGGSIWGHYKDPSYIWGFLLRNLERFLGNLWENDIEVAGLRVILLCSDGSSCEAQVRLPQFTQDQSLLMEALKLAFKKAFRPGLSYCRVHIVGHPMRQWAHQQSALFDNPQKKSDPVIRQLKMQVNGRFGLFTLRNASTANAAEVFKDKVSDFEITDVPGKHLF